MPSHHPTSLSSDPESTVSELRLLGIRFWTGETDDLLQWMDTHGGVLTVPSGPSLGATGSDPFLLEAYRSSTWAVVDGGYVALILRCVLRRKAPRISGLQLIERLFADPELAVPMRERNILWVVPHDAERKRISAFLESKGFELDHQDFYEAPFYQTDADFNDTLLIQRIEDEQPDWIVLCIGGGRQEKLAHWIGRQTQEVETSDPDDEDLKISHPAILCTGAAIAFFTGGQAQIPRWADRCYLGWLFRILEEPRLYLPRYFDAAWQLPVLLWRFRRDLWENQ